MRLITGLNTARPLETRTDSSCPLRLASPFPKGSATPPDAAADDDGDDDARVFPERTAATPGRNITQRDYFTR